MLFVVMSLGIGQAVGHVARVSMHGLWSVVELSCSQVVALWAVDAFRVSLLSLLASSQGLMHVGLV